MYDERVCSNFIDLHATFPISFPTFPAPFAEETVFLPFYILTSFF